MLKTITKNKCIVFILTLLKFYNKENISYHQIYTVFKSLKKSVLEHRVPLDVPLMVYSFYSTY